MKQVICNSGVTGWQCKLRANYSTYSEFKAYSDNYGIAERLGYKSAKKAWNENPTIQGSVNPSDLRKVN